MENKRKVLVKMMVDTDIDASINIQSYRETMRNAYEKMTR